jgi:hypothetical protein
MTAMAKQPEKPAGDDNAPIDHPVNPNAVGEAGEVGNQGVGSAAPGSGFTPEQMASLKELMDSLKESIKPVPVSAGRAPGGSIGPSGHSSRPQRGQAGPDDRARRSAGLPNNPDESAIGGFGDGSGIPLGPRQGNPDDEGRDAFGDIHYDAMAKPEPKMGAGDDPPRLMTDPPNPNRPDTPNNDFIHGVKGKLKFIPLEGGSAVVFDIEQISVDDDVQVDDITNTSAAGAQVVLDGIQKITGTIQFVYDALNVFLVAPAPFKPRTYVTLNVLLDGITPLMFGALIHGFTTSTGPKAGTVRISCKYQSTGPITYPTASQTTPTPALTS